MTAPSSRTLRIRLVDHANTSALLRVVSILHSRCAAVSALSFSSCDGRSPTVRATVSVLNTGTTTLRDSLLRPIEVIDVTEVDGIDAVHRSAHRPARVEHRER